MYTSNVTYEREVTVDDVVDEANKIWGEVKKMPVDNLDSVDRILSDLRRTHREFSISYPIVLRYMVQMKAYSPKALRTFLERMKYHPVRSHDDYLESCVDYITILYKQTQGHWDRREAENVRKNIRQTLFTEREKMKKDFERIEEIVNAREEEMKLKKREIFIAALKRQAAPGHSTNGA